MGFEQPPQQDNQEIKSSKYEKEYTAEEIERMLDSFRLIGPDKPVGYLPIDTLVFICKVDPSKFAEELESKGLKTMILAKDRGNGSLYAYDEKSLKKLLDGHRKILEDAGWPAEPEDFVQHLDIQAEPGTELFDLIADAFGDKANMLRLDKKDS